MAKLDTNLDACQLSGEILLRLRKIIREGLLAAYGKTWEETGIPEEIRDFLIQRQARETSINWNLSESVDVLDFAGYVNLHNIISATPHLLERFLPLAPDASVLRIRFLELDTILNRIAYCRPISEGDLGFLVSFEDRLKKTTATVPTAVEEGAAPPAPQRAAGGGRTRAVIPRGAATPGSERRRAGRARGETGAAARCHPSARRSAHARSANAAAYCHGRPPNPNGLRSPRSPP